MSLKDKVLESYDEKKAVELLKMMIETPSVTGDETELARKVAEFMRRNGFDEVELQEVKDGKYQTIGTMKGTGGGRSMMLCGHLDIFPPPENMVDPYKAVIDGDRIYGAGVGDMKAGTAATVMAVDAIIQSGVEIKGDIVVALVMEEEIGGVGITHLLRRGVTADMGIVPESTNLNLSTTGAGITQFMVTTIGKSVHISGKEHGVDAVEKMSHVIHALNELEFTYEPDPRVPLLPRHVASTIIGGRGRNYDLRGAQNLSDYCSLIIDVRFWKSQNVQSIEKDIRRLLDKLASMDPEFRYELTGVPVPFGNRVVNRNPKDLPRDSEIVRIVQNNHRYVTGREPRFRELLSTAGNDDGVHMIEAGIPTVTYGPGCGDVSPEEYSKLALQSRWIDLGTYHKCCKVMAAATIDVVA
ncbi:M20/M25/M40 family metallo-hydrolase [Candidatus Bathyarchaeota archaeon]|nr:M20/M25/M40 family metallo-hydrolase [Candidatus Bathyarchaeota archaeon]